jgi:hypothetical protein
MTNPSNKQITDYEKVGRLMEEVVATGYSRPTRLLWYSFIRGIAYGLGIFLAGTLVVGLVIWALSIFDQVPVIGKFVQHIINGLTYGQ